jgi:hypothetical protein
MEFNAITDHKYRILCLYSGKAIYVKNKTTIVQHSVDNKYTQEVWRFIKLDDGSYQIVSQDSNAGAYGLSLTAGEKEGDLVTLAEWRSHSNPDQKWNITDVKIPYYPCLFKIESQKNNLVVGVQAASQGEDAKIVMHVYQSYQNQVWFLHDLID